MKTTERKMAAILAMDVVSYSEKMGRDEEGTLKHLRACREIIENIVTENRGRIFNTAGDAFMIEFSSAVSAVSAAVDIQKLIDLRNESLPASEQMKFRIGVNVGDIIIEDNNLYGEGVNVAARLESIAEPGGISISDKVYSEVRRKFNFAFEDRGQQELKNIEDPVHVYQLNIKGPASTPVLSGTKKESFSKSSTKSFRYLGAALAVVVTLGIGWMIWINKGGEKNTTQPLAANTLVVLPMDTSSPDNAHKNFAAGLTQDIANGLSGVSKMLNVVRLSKRPDDIAVVGPQTGAQYLIDGNLRQAGDKFRLSISLINASTMSTVWSKAYDKQLAGSDIFATQDEIVNTVVGEIAGLNNSAISKDIIQKAKTRGTENLSAYECVSFVRGTFYVSFQADDFSKGMNCLQQAVGADPNYVEARLALASMQRFGYSFGILKDPQVIADGLSHLDYAIKLEPSRADLYSTRAGLLFMQKNWPAMFKALDKAYELAPNNVNVVNDIGYSLLWGGDCSEKQFLDWKAPKDTYVSGGCQWQKGFEMLKRADELDRGNAVPGKHYGLTSAYAAWGQYELALKHIQLVPSPGFFWYEVYSGYIAEKTGDKMTATQHFEMVKKAIGSSKLEALEKQFDFWNGKKWWNIYEPVFVRYGFT
jgi:class 3 adenylate cyclase/TolB-like protein